MDSNTKNSSTPIQYSFFLSGLILASVFGLAVLFKDSAGYFIFLFFGGWLTWTFVEYSIHRFLLHDMYVPSKKESLFHHHEHHINPQNIKINSYHRTFSFFLGIAIVWIALELNNIFSIFAGFFVGFLMYSYLHYLLHQPYCKFILPKIQRAHILHHTTNPDQGYSFSTVLWDYLFGTLPSPNVEVTEKMKRFYFESSKIQFEKKDQSKSYPS